MESSLLANIKFVSLRLWGQQYGTWWSLSAYWRIVLSLQHIWLHTMLPYAAPGTQKSTMPTVACHQQYRTLTFGVPSECFFTKVLSRDQRGKIQMFFSLAGAFTAVKFPIANHHSQINVQLNSASITQIFRVRVFVKVESASNKLLITALKSGLK